MSLIALKSRKKTIDMIYRASCAMKAAAVVRVRKIEKCISDFAIAKKMIDATENEIIENIILPHMMNQSSVNKINILIACDKGMCGEFMSSITGYFKHNKNNGDYWLVFGAKLEFVCKDAVAKGNDRVHFLGNTFLNQIDLFIAVGKVLEFVRQHFVREVNLHYFEKDKIVVKNMCSKERVEEAIVNGQDEQKQSYLPVEYAQLLFASYLYTAMLSSMLEENKQRLVAMTQAKTNAEDMGKLIARLYNKARQEKITLELNEITAGII